MKQDSMTYFLKHKKIIYISISVILVFLAITIYKARRNAIIKQEQNQFWEEIQTEYNRYCDEAPEKLRTIMALDDNVKISVSKREYTWGGQNGSKIYFFYDDIDIAINNVSDFSNVSGKAKYTYMKKISDATKKAAQKIKNEYSILSMSQYEREKKADRSMCFSTNVHVSVYADGKYSLWDSVNIVYRGNEKIYDPGEEVYKDNASDSESGYRPTGNMTFNGMMTDPDDYDDPDDFAEDAWGIDFDDYDEAYDYWENW